LNKNDPPSPACGGLRRAGKIDITDKNYRPIAKRGDFKYNSDMLSKEQVVKIAELARIALTDAEVEKFQKELSTVLDYVDELKAVDVTGLEEVAQVTGLVNVQRQDKIIEAENHDAILSQAPEIKDGYYKVKAIL
jgi:aspartyl-tRNA(Asn)/glutamyl-tRNA(Gln) amidotransferase subunit C